ncbi:uncharacterized protein LOC126463931 [Schistocerca serialis cubense]|uniref:uncharacterized protein LOC126463931 n=1 Tax=Schistocerca serialis cubense TaxID=2023355 RepID=UPI00214E9EDA|nr:uncharacterized protein LOC126463931 [Schistocerca serialis cubense]XP_049952155.1 uncharacterized protein LOC126463931 [Schistocerca serialis cubense]
MGSTDSERSISSGISIPQWMKSKIGDRYDIEETFSPPTHDDTFFYIRYPKSKPVAQPENDSYRPISEVLEEKPLKQRDFSKHTQPCKEFIPEANGKENTSSLVGGATQMQSRVNKSQGTDDGYVGEAAACGKSVVQVAQQMIAGNRLTLRGAEQAMPPKERHRRNSKSLPTSPLGSPSVSPKLQRKKQGEPQNRYFTGVFGVPTQYPGSWILSGVLGQRDIAALQTNIQETASQKSSLDDGKQSDVRRNKSSSSLVRTSTEGSRDEDQSSSDGESSPGLVKKEMFFRAKPSELREMNFLSPTSM